MALDLFTPIVPPDRLHPIFQLLLEDRHAPERAALNLWAQGFQDRDGKFVHELQLTFESSFWELYLHAVLRELGVETDMSFDAPDFVAVLPHNFCIEATIAGPAQGGHAAFGYDAMEALPEDFTDFNIQAAIRICNAFDAKVRRYNSRYRGLPQSQNKPYVIAIGAFDRPYSHFAANRAIVAALYGLYFDEAATRPDADNVVRYNVSSAPKSPTADVPVGLFCDATHADVSAVIYSSVATWGKLRAMADNPSALTVYQTFYPSDDGLLPRILTRKKSEYEEHLLDGLYVLHNPFATYPLPKGTLSHLRLCEVHVAQDGELDMQAPEDFLLVRTLRSIVARD